MHPLGCFRLFVLATYVLLYKAKKKQPIFYCYIALGQLLIDLMPELKVLVC